MSIMTNNQTKLFNFMLQIEQGNDTAELYADIKNAYDDEHYAISIMDALMKKYADATETFKSAYIACGLDEKFMKAECAVKVLDCCTESLTIKASDRTARSEFYKEVIALADTLDNENFKFSLYTLIASTMLNGLMISDNIELAKKINEVVYDKDTTETNLPSYVITTIGRV